MVWIDLNADLGEGCGDDDGLMAIISSANIACGGHAGDEASMRAALKLAKSFGVSAGAHPAYPDREGFGRRSLDIDKGILGMSLVEQISSLQKLAGEVGLTLQHVKPHGALYNDAADEESLAREVVSAIQAAAPGAAVVGLPDSALQVVSAERGVPFIAEGFADRGYTAAGRLVSRRQPDAVIELEDQRVAQALAFAKGRPIQAVTGEVLLIKVQTICLHGDSPGALASAKVIRSALEAQGISVQARIS